jgi:hypothetical protein
MSSQIIESLFLTDREVEDYFETPYHVSDPRAPVEALECAPSEIERVEYNTEVLPVENPSYGVKFSCRRFRICWVLQQRVQK